MAQYENNERMAIGRVIACGRALYFPIPVVVARFMGVKKGDRLALFTIAVDELVVKRIPMEELRARIIYRSKTAHAEEVIV